MKVLITGAGGMLGRKLTARLANDNALNAGKVTQLILHDIVDFEPEKNGLNIQKEISDIAQANVAEGLVAQRPDIIFHLAGVVSGAAEADLELGYRANLDGTRKVFDSIRKTENYCPKVVFASSIAVFGAPFPEAIGDDFAPVPLSSYGVQKLMSEHLLNDYSRRGILDGVGIRLPTICVRPGKPNAAASSFFSSIIREPLVSKKAYVPVSRDVVHTHASPRAAINFLVQAANLNTTKLGNRRNLSMPGVAVSVAQQIEALKCIAGNDIAKLIEDKPDATINAIVENWPQRFSPVRSVELGFRAETSFDDIINAHIEDELHG